MVVKGILGGVQTDAPENLIFFGIARLYPREVLTAKKYIKPDFSKLDKNLIWIYTNVSQSGCSNTAITFDS